MSRRSHAAVLAVSCGLLALIGQGLFGAPPDLRPVMPEVDGVHPIRALAALHEAYAPGGGFPDKYPPLGSALFGVLASLVDPALAEDAGDVAGLAATERAARLWPLRDRLARVLGVQRWLSRLAMAGSVALLALLGAALARRAGAGAGAAALGGGLAALGLGLSYPALYYANTTNVDALVLLFALGSLASGLARRWILAALLAAAATAVKDPAFVLGPVLLVAAACDGREGRGRRVLLVAGSGTLAYLALAGALTGPTVWWEHLRYILGGGVSGVDRIDPADPGAWSGLLGYCGHLVLGAVGWSGAALAAIGLMRLARADRPACALLLGAVLATLVLFVVPVGFVYVRFLLLPLAVLALAAGVALSCLLDPAGPKRRWIGLVGVIVLAGLADAAVLDWHRHLHDRPDARALSAAALSAELPAGSRIALVADAREHGPPLDPLRFELSSFGLDEAPERLAAWRAAAPERRPEHLLWMSFPNDLPSGAATPAPALPAVGDRLGGIYTVRAVFGAPTGRLPERSLAVRPTISWLVAADG